MHTRIKWVFRKSRNKNGAGALRTLDARGNARSTRLAQHHLKHGFTPGSEFFLISSCLLLAGWCWLVPSLALADQPPPNGQPDSKTAASQAPATGPPDSAKVKVSGSLRLRAENWNWFEADAAESDYTFGAALLRLGLGQRKEKFDWQVEAAAPLLISLPENAVAPAPQGQLGFGGSYFAANGQRDGSIFLKQAFVAFK